MQHDRGRLWGWKAALAVLTVLAAMPFPATAQTELLTRQLDAAPAVLPQLEREGPWLRVCEAQAEGDHCRYEQTVAASNGDEVILTLLAPPPNDRVRTPVALFRTPLHALLPPGLTLKFDSGASGSIGFRACSPRGCIASVALEGAVRSNMARANRVAAQFTTQSMETVTAEFSLAGSAAILSGM